MKIELQIERLVWNLAGVNRPKDPEEFRKGNFGFASTLLETLKKHGNKAPVMLSSSIQATLAGRFGKSEYGLSKKAGEELFFDYAAQTGAKVLVYRFPNLVGKWVRPNYNSAVGTFCNNIANDLPITVNDPSVVLEMLFIARDALHRRPGGGDVRRARRQGAPLRVPGRGRSGRRCDLRRTDAALYRGRQVLLRDGDPQGDAGIHRGVPAQVPRPAGDPDHAADRAGILREEAVFHVPVLFAGG